MIKSAIKIQYPHQHSAIVQFEEGVHVADYTEQTKTLPKKRSVEFFSPNPPSDISYFTIANHEKIELSGIEFDNSSFVYPNGNTKSQCEAVFFPQNSTPDSWILFCELKYSNMPKNNERNLKKAIKQLLKTRYHYLQENVISKTNTQYLLASLPLQSEPFANFILTQSDLLKLKSKRNIIMRLKNSVEIKSNQFILV
jgi:hypothetical protein